MKLQFSKIVVYTYGKKSVVLICNDFFNALLTWKIVEEYKPFAFNILAAVYCGVVISKLILQCINTKNELILSWIPFPCSFVPN